MWSVTGYVHLRLTKPRQVLSSDFDLATCCHSILAIIAPYYGGDFVGNWPNACTFKANVPRPVISFSPWDAEWTLPPNDSDGFELKFHLSHYFINNPKGTREEQKAARLYWQHAHASAVPEGHGLGTHG